jgi:hypothetical protein
LDLGERKWQEAGEDCIMRSFITCTLHQILRVMKSMMIRWAGHVTRMREMRNPYRIFVRKPEAKRH